MLRFEFVSKTNRKIFEKNPNKGGTPANDSRVTAKTFVKKFEVSKFAKE